MKTARVLFVALSILCCEMSVQALDSPKVAQAKYDELAAKVRSGDTMVDWQALRPAAEVGGVEGNYDLRDANQRGTKAFNDGKFEDSLKIANEMLAHNVASGDGHFSGDDLTEASWTPGGLRQGACNPRCVFPIDYEVG